MDDAPEASGIKHFENDVEIFMAADVVFKLLKPMFAGPSDLASTLTALLVVTWKAYNKREEAGIEQLLELIRKTWTVVDTRPQGKPRSPLH